MACWPAGGGTSFAAVGQQPLTHTVTRVECTSMSANWRSSAAVSSGLHSSVALVSSGLPCEGSAGEASWVRGGASWVRGVQPGHKPGWASPRVHTTCTPGPRCPTPARTFESMRLSWPTAQGRHAERPASAITHGSKQQMAPNGPVARSAARAALASFPPGKHIGVQTTHGSSAARTALWPPCLPVSTG